MNKQQNPSGSILRELKARKILESRPLCRIGGRNPYDAFAYIALEEPHPVFHHDLRCELKDERTNTCEDEILHEPATAWARRLRLGGRHIDPEYQPSLGRGRACTPYVLPGHYGLGFCRECPGVKPILFQQNNRRLIWLHHHGELRLVCRLASSRDTALCFRWFRLDGSAVEQLHFLLLERLDDGVMLPRKIIGRGRQRNRPSGSSYRASPLAVGSGCA